MFPHWPVDDDYRVVRRYEVREFEDGSVKEVDVGCSELFVGLMVGALLGFVLASLYFTVIA